MTVGGLTIEQKVVTVLNSDTEINDSITAEAADDWAVTSLTLSGTDIIILFTKTEAAS